MTKTEQPDPIVLFRSWLEEAEKSEPADPSATALATADAAGAPSVRMVLLRGLSEHGFVFFTNLESRKSKELLANPQAALCFHWKSLDRQVRVEGPIELVSDEEADTYFASRERTSQIGAWASRQSQTISERFELEKRVAKYTAKFGVGRIPRPDFWSGFRLSPKHIEFWQKRQFRLHKRVVYSRSDNYWTTKILFP